MNYKRVYSENLGGLVWDRKDYCIHHIDLNHFNDRFENLILIPSKLHRKFHFLYKSVCFDSGLFSNELYGAACTDILAQNAIEFLDIKKQMERFYDLKRMILEGFFYDEKDFQKIVDSCCFINEQWKRR